MPKISDAYPSKYVSAADLDEQDMVLTIASIDTQAFEDGTTKLVLFSHETTKGLVLNKTNARTIAAMYGDDTDEWSGRRITIYPTWVDFAGKQTEAVRVRPKPPREKARAAEPSRSAAQAKSQGTATVPVGRHREPGDDDEPVDDDIPY